MAKGFQRISYSEQVHSLTYHFRWWVSRVLVGSFSFLQVVFNKLIGVKMSVHKRAFYEVFDRLARRHNRYKVFNDFVTISAISLHNGIRKVESLEQEYFGIIADYSKEEVSAFAKLLGILVMLLEPEPTDILGQLYMELEISNKKSGQYFTPDDISRLMAELVYGEKTILPDDGFVTLCEPACGAGGMVLAFVKKLISQKLNPAYHLWVQCTDIDRTVALMCYVQLSLWNVPAQIIVGDTLTMQYREQYFTPAYYLFNWPFKLKNRFAGEKEKTNTQDKQTEESELPSSSDDFLPDDEIVQFDLFNNL